MRPPTGSGKKELKKWRRNIILEKPNASLVLDEIHSNKKAKIQLRFHSDVEVNIQDDFVLRQLKVKLKPDLSEKTKALFNRQCN